MKALSSKKKIFALLFIFLVLSTLLVSFAYTINNSQNDFDSSSHAFTPSISTLFFSLSQEKGTVINEDGTIITFPDANTRYSWIGNGKSKSSSYLGLIFTNIPLDSQAILSEVYLEFTGDNSVPVESKGKNQFCVKIYAEDTLQPAVFSDDNPPSIRSTGKASRKYCRGSVWEYESRYYIEITNVIKDLIKGKSHADGLSILLKGDDKSNYRRYFNASDESKAPRLVIKYKASSIKNTLIPTITTIVSSTPTQIPSVTSTPQPTERIQPTPTKNASTPTTIPSPLITNTPPVPSMPMSGGKHVYPNQNLATAMESLIPGETLYVHGGTYKGKIELNKNKAKKGTPSSPIIVKAFPGERPVIEGLLWLTWGPDYWIFDGINVTWDNTIGKKGDHMVKFTGKGWKFTNAEVWGAKSYAAIQISGNATDWTLSHLKIHDTYATNEKNQDHLIYVSNASNGIIERNILYNSPNGRAIKLGLPTDGGAVPSNVIIRYNTMYNNMGPSNVQLSYGASNNQIYRNIMVKSGDYNVTVNSGYHGENNIVKDNVGWDSKGTVSVKYGNSSTGNLFINPELNIQTFVPGNTSVVSYGLYSP